MNNCGFMLGRLSREDNLTRYCKPELNEAAPPVPEGVYITIADAPLGVIAWQTNKITYFENTTKVVENSIR